MSSTQQEDAERKFWRLPELVEMLLPFLDGPSTLALVKALPLALEIIQRKSMWIKLVKRVCPFDSDDVVEWGEEFEKLVANDKRKVMPLVEILKMTENPKPLLLDLLHTICERFPPVDREDVPEEARGYHVNTIPGPEFFEVSCSCRGSRRRRQATHAVCPYGFLLLEEVERIMGTTEQKIQWVVLDDLEEPWLTDLDSRLLRQQGLGVDTEVDLANLTCNSKESAEAVSNLMRQCKWVDVQNSLDLGPDLGSEGWAALAKAFSWIREDARIYVDWVDSVKVDTASARREDLKSIWEGVGPGWSLWLDLERSQAFEDWSLFEKCLDGEETGVPVLLFNGEEHVIENENEDGDRDEVNDV